MPSSPLALLPPSAVSSEANVSWLHRFAAFVAVVEFLALVLGAMGHLTSGAYPSFSPWIIEISAALFVILAVWLAWGGAARYLKILGWGTAGLAVMQALVWGTASRLDPSTAQVLTHTPLTLLIFGLAVLLALFTRTDWRWDLPKVPDVAAPSFRQLSVFTTLTLFADMVVGSIHARGLMRLAPHFIGGILVSAGALWMLEIALNKFSALRALKIAAIILAELVIIELLLGLVSYRTEVDSHALAHPLPGLAVMRATHAALGALTLAASLTATLQSFKYLARRATNL